MNTFTINFTDMIGNFWTIDWTPSTSRNTNLSDKDIHAVVQYIKTGVWPKNTTAAAKNCYDTLAAQIAHSIVELATSSRKNSFALTAKISRAWADHKLSKKGDALYKRFEELGQEEMSTENTLQIRKLMKKIIKSENLFAVKFAEDKTWLVEVMTDLKCCICGDIIENELQGHNPYPVRPESWYGEKEYRCCTCCNQRIVIPARIRFGRNDNHHRNTFMKMDYEELLDFVA
jgi:hypothetical protein